MLLTAADRDLVVAFVGQPHRINDRGSQVLKALREIGFEQYYQAEQTGWVLYLAGSTDLAIMQAFARRLRHNRAIQAFERPFVKYVGNQLPAVQNHYYGLREAFPALGGVALFDRLESEPLDISPVKCLIWKRREIENYVCSRPTLEAYADAATGSLFTSAEEGKRQNAMGQAIEEVESALKTLGKGSPWNADVKASDDFLVPLFKSYFETLGLPKLMARKISTSWRSASPIARLIPRLARNWTRSCRSRSARRLPQTRSAIFRPCSLLFGGSEVTW